VQRLGGRWESNPCPKLETIQQFDFLFVAMENDPVRMSAESEQLLRRLANRLYQDPALYAFTTTSPKVRSESSATAFTLRDPIAPRPGRDAAAEPLFQRALMIREKVLH
jgi:hypothetical protein